jgi:hypothetical protein
MADATQLLARHHPHSNVRRRGVPLGQCRRCRASYWFNPSCVSRLLNCGAAVPHIVEATADNSPLRLVPHVQEVSELWV